MKKIILTLYGILLAISSSQLSYAFSDVSLDNPDFVPILYFHEIGVVNGNEDGTFGPEHPVSRAAALKILLSAAGKEIPTETTEQIFTDVPADAWFAPYVAAGVSAGIISDSQSKFRPGDTLNRAEIAKMLVEVFEVDLSQYPVEGELTDVASDVWFAPYVKFLVYFNVFGVSEEGGVLPEQSVSRQELLRYMFVLLANGGGLNPETLLQLADRSMSQTLPALQSGELVAAVLYTNHADTLSSLALNLLPENPTLQGVDKMVEALRNFLLGNSAFSQEMLDEAITYSKTAWAAADEAATLEPKLETLEQQVQSFASQIAEAARAAGGVDGAGE